MTFRNSLSFDGNQAWIQIPVLKFASYVTLNKCLNYSDSLVLPCVNGRQSSSVAASIKLNHVIFFLVDTKWIGIYIQLPFNLPHFILSSYFVVYMQIIQFTGKFIKYSQIEYSLKGILLKYNLYSSSPVVMYGCESWTIKKAEHRGIDGLKLWFWSRLLRVFWTERRSNQSILKEINPEYSLEGLMLKLKLQNCDHLMWRVDS